MSFANVLLLTSVLIACTNLLEHFVSLEVLDIKYDMNLQSDSPDTSAASLSRLLRLLPVPGRLRRLVIKGNSWVRGLTMEDFDWIADLDAELVHEHFHGLTEVVCHFSMVVEQAMFMSKEHIMALVEGKLRKLSSRSSPVLQIDIDVAWR